MSCCAETSRATLKSYEPAAVPTPAVAVRVSAPLTLTVFWSNVVGLRSAVADDLSVLSRVPSCV